MGPEHATVGTDGHMAILTIVTHLYLMFLTFLFDSFTLVYGVEHVPDIPDESLALSEVGKRHHFPTMRTLLFLLLNPSAEASLAGYLTTVGTHFWFL